LWSAEVGGMTDQSRYRSVAGEQSETREPAIKLIPFDQITVSTQRRDLVRGLIPRVGLTLIWGSPKSGKSLWVLDLAMHVALGRNYRGRRVHQGPVVYCALEGQGGFGARCEAFRLKFLEEHHGPIPLYLVSATLDLVRDRVALIAAIQTALGTIEPVAVVLDTLNRSLVGSESNDEDMAAYIRAADAIREAFSCAVIVVHHCGIDATRPRGHTSLTGAADAQLSVRRDADNVIVSVEYAKDGPQGDRVASRLESVKVGTDEDGEPITSCVVMPADTEVTTGCGVTGAAKHALDCLRKAINESGEPAPAGDHQPPSMCGAATARLERLPKATSRTHCGRRLSEHGYAWKPMESLESRRIVCG
jgi:hypothetical protein